VGSTAQAVGSGPGGNDTPFYGAAAATLAAHAANSHRRKAGAAGVSGRAGGQTKKYPRAVLTGSSNSGTNCPLAMSSSTSGSHPSATP
jgi:hypothetical protein